MVDIVPSARYFKKPKISTTLQTSINKKVDELVGNMVNKIYIGKEVEVKKYAKELDQFDGPIVITPDIVEFAISKVSKEDKDTIQFAYKRIKKFAEAQKMSMQDTEIEINPGFFAGSKYVPVDSVGCYVPGGRYTHIASALMGVTTAKVAGVKYIIASTPPKPEKYMYKGKVVQIPNPAVLFALKLAGANKILCLGGVQAIASMGFGLFNTGVIDDKPANIICGPGNSYVTAAKRILFMDYSIGFDLIAGPTEVCILADETANADKIAIDLVSQCEHGPDSVAVLVTTSEEIALNVSNCLPSKMNVLPEPNRSAAKTSWKNYGEIILCKSKTDVVKLSDYIASEHLEVHAADLNWWHNNLKNYGSLFLGEHSTVAFGDKAAGPNHILPTRKAAQYTGGVYVGTFLKCLSFQRSINKSSVKDVANATARISRLEGMEGHAIAADARL
eukprot:g2489.t1